MRRILLGAASLCLVAACSRAPGNTVASGAPTSAAAAPTVAAARSSGAPVSGSYTADGKPAVLTTVTAHKGDPFDGKPITELVFTAKDQGGDAQAAVDALFGKFGDAVIARVEPDGTVVGADLVHAGLKQQGPVSLSGALTMKTYRNEGGQVSGELASGGPTDVFDHKVDVDLIFHASAP
ncbi:MAG TPA: hypothetical protein VKT30_11885 [Caulobacteraceae bacterium]|nr:hypothetical protein [Caulobacteraceae bacterium]